MMRMLRWGRAPEEVAPPDIISVDRALKTAPELPQEDEPHPALKGLERACLTLEAVPPILKRLRAHVHSMSETAIAASTEEDLGLRALMGEDYEDHLAAVPAFAPKDGDATISLLGEKARGLRVPLDTGGDYAIAPFAITIAPHGLNLEPPKGAFALHREVAETLTSLTAALDRLDGAGLRYQKDHAFLLSRVQRLKSPETHQNGTAQP